MNFAEPFLEKHISHLAVSIAPQGAFEVDFNITRDTNQLQTHALDQRGGDVLGPADADVCILGSTPIGSGFDGSILGSGDAIDVYASLEDGDSFRKVFFEMMQDKANQGAEINNFAIRLHMGSLVMEN